MRKFLLAAMAVVMVMGISRTAEAVTANQLLDWCNANSESLKSLCIGFTSGFTLGVSIANQGQKQGAKICFPEGFAGSQLRKMFVKSAEENPEKLHLSIETFLFTVTAMPFFRIAEQGDCD